MAATRIERLSGVVRKPVRRTYGIREDQDEAIQNMARRTGDSWSVIVRRALDLGLAAELESMKERGVPDTGAA